MICDCSFNLLPPLKTTDMFVICNYMEKKKKSFIWIFKSFFLFALAFVAMKSFYEACGESWVEIASQQDTWWVAVVHAQGKIRMKVLCLHRDWLVQHSPKSNLYVEYFKIVAFFLP